MLFRIGRQFLDLGNQDVLFNAFLTQVMSVGALHFANVMSQLVPLGSLLSFANSFQMKPLDGQRLRGNAAASRKVTRRLPNMSLVLQFLCILITQILNEQKFVCSLEKRARSY